MANTSERKTAVDHTLAVERCFEAPAVTPLVVRFEIRPRPCYIIPKPRPAMP